MILDWILDFLLTGVAIFAIGSLLPGVHVKNYGTALWVALLISFFNATVGFILRVVTFPFNWLTMGLIYFIIYVFVIWIVDKLVENFRINGFWWTVLFALLLSFTGGLIDRWIYL